MVVSIRGQIYRWSGRRHAITEPDDQTISSLRKKYSSKYDCYRDSEDDEETERITELTEVHKRVIRALRKIKYFVARRKFKEAFRPYDVKDVIEQYSAGHIDMLSRVKGIQSRIDMILGKCGSKKADVYESKISLASRIVKVERQVDDIETKLDFLIDMYKEDRMRHHTLENKCCQSNTSANQNHGQSRFQYPTLRSILLDRNDSTVASQSKSALPDTAQSTHARNPDLQRPKQRTIFRNKSDLEPRLRKKVTYRSVGSSMDALDRSGSSGPVSILKKHSVSSEPSEPDIQELVDSCDRLSTAENNTELQNNDSAFVDIYTDDNDPGGVTDPRRRRMSVHSEKRRAYFRMHSPSPDEDPLSGLDDLPETVIDLHISEDDESSSLDHTNPDASGCDFTDRDKAPPVIPMKEKLLQNQIQVEVSSMPNAKTSTVITHTPSQRAPLQNTRTTNIHIDDFETPDSVKFETPSVHNVLPSNSSGIVFQNERQIDSNSLVYKDRLSSWNSTESEYMSDREDSSLTDDVTEATPLRSDVTKSQLRNPSKHVNVSSSCAPFVRPNAPADRKAPSEDRRLTNTFHLKPESQVLLMRPEVLKLRKTSC